MRSYFKLTKFTLSFLVVFSYIIGFLLAPTVEGANIGDIIWLVISGFSVTGAANAANQLAERETDKLMSRTQNRPLVTQELSLIKVKIFIAISLTVGLWVLFLRFNYKAALLAAFSFFIYVYIYTPMKKISPIAVFIGAAPGAFPCLIGWVAATNDFSRYGWILFCIQFFWQFPHFWSLAWLVNEDYKKAGYRLLPFGMQPGRIVAFQTFAFSLLLLMVCLVPYFVGLASFSALVPIALANGALIFYSIRLSIRPAPENARKVMFACYVHLPIVLLSLLLFKTY